MRAILLLLVAGVVVGSSLAGAARQTARAQSGAMGELGATHCRRAAWQGGARRRLGVHLHQLDSYLAIYQGVESRLRARSAWSWSGCTRQSSSSASAPRTSTAAFATMG